MEALVAHVKEVDLHDALYEQYTSEPLFKLRSPQETTKIETITILNILFIVIV